ncbi:hypothetical protein FKM82_009226 [Ascaphus truei]
MKKKKKEKKYASLGYSPDFLRPHMKNCRYLNAVLRSMQCDHICSQATMLLWVHRLGLNLSKAAQAYNVLSTVTDLSNTDRINAAVSPKKKKKGEKRYFPGIIH